MMTRQSSGVGMQLAGCQVLSLNAAGDVCVYSLVQTAAGVDVDVGLRSGTCACFPTHHDS